MKRRFLCLVPVFLLTFGATARAGGEATQPSGKFVLQSARIVPQAGDSMVKRLVTWHDPGQKGANLTWDFSKSGEIDKECPVNYYLNGENRLTGCENATNYRYRVTNDSMLLTGYENAMMVVELQSPALLMKFPLKYGDQTTGSFYGKGKYCDRLEYLFSGSVETTADGYGTLIVPGDTLNNAIRVHIKSRVVDHYRPLEEGFDLYRPFKVEEISDTLRQSLNKAGYVETDVYRWYVEGSRYPVFETVDVRRMKSQNVTLGTDTIKELTHTAYLFAPRDQQQQLPENTINQQQVLKAGHETGIQDVKTGQNIHVYPNPVVDNLNVTMQLQGQQDVQLFLYDMKGRTLYRSQPNKATGYFSETIGVSHLPQGNYVLRVQVGDKSDKKVIVKQ